MPKRTYKKISPQDDIAPINHIWEFDYLGYKFSIRDPFIIPKLKYPDNYNRDIHIDISNDKVKKIKTRLICSFKDFCKNKNFILLSKRIKYLTGNYSITDRNTGMKRMSGIYYNYNFISTNHSTNLGELDTFLKKAVLSSRGKIFLPLSVYLTKIQKKSILTNSFSRGFSKKTFYHFDCATQSLIQRCWKYVK